MKLGQRIYEDYFKKSRLPKYKEVLTLAKENGYKMVGIMDFYNLVASGEIGGGIKLLVNRHDIDTSPKVARRLFEIEKEVYGKEGSATYYFRNSTIDSNLISEIESYGYETGYHYEEIATYEKQHKLKSRAALEQAMPQIREEFVRDLDNFRKTTGSKSLTVVSHGDFINTRYKFQNYELLKDENTRNKSGITLEAYDAIVNEPVKERYADQVLLDSFSDNVKASIEKGCPCIMMLTHPRNWTVDVSANTKDNIIRLLQDLKYRL